MDYVTDFSIFSATRKMIRIEIIWIRQPDPHTTRTSSFFNATLTITKLHYNFPEEQKLKEWKYIKKGLSDYWKCWKLGSFSVHEVQSLSHQDLSQKTYSIHRKVLDFSPCQWPKQSGFWLKNWWWQSRCIHQ